MSSGELEWMCLVHFELFFRCFLRPSAGLRNQLNGLRTVDEFKVMSRDSGPVGFAQVATSTPSGS